jgi:hypothetical protein
MQISRLDLHIRVIFLLSASARLLRLLNAVSIHYPQIGNRPILNGFKNNLTNF